ncbi:MAG TPA: replicative DNA helicase [Thermodesulfobacteriota bacterium]|nr:replicative DNA helicase [Thermodesulfobacteriota bacterium]
MIDLSTKPLPQNLEAEQAVLGAVLIEGNAINQVLEIVARDDFYKDSHRKIFDAMIELDRVGKPIDILTLFDYLKSRGQLLEEVGGSGYLTYLTEVVPSTVNVEYYARLVKEKAILRKLVITATDIAKGGFQDGVDVDDFLSRAEQSIFNIGEHKVKPSFYETRELAAKALEIIETLHEKKELITGVPTGFEKLDHMTSGLQPSDLIIVAARPGLGKTSFCLNIATHASLEHGAPVGIFSLEMSKEQLMLRMLSSEAKVNYSHIRSGFIRNEDLEKLVKAADKYRRAKLYIDDTPAIGILELRAKTRRCKREKGLELIIVDYLQLMRGTGGRTETREREIAEISASLKALAKELEMPVIAVSQLSRQTEARADRRPQLSDLRESGALEQDADVVIFIHRADAYRTKPEDKEKKDGIAEIIVGKQRNGPTGTVKLAFLSEKIGVPSFENLTEEYEEMEVF